MNRIVPSRGWLFLAASLLLGLAPMAVRGDEREGGDDFDPLYVFSSVVQRIEGAYVDPARVDPRAMLRSALDAVQRQAAEVRVEPGAEELGVLVAVDARQQEFSLAEVDSAATLSLMMQRILGFIRAHVQPGTDFREIEYAAANGALSALDPHSVLLDPQVYAEMRLATSGKFGGIGLVVGIRKDALTAIRVIPGTPAFNAGIRAGDRITRIGTTSTANMMLSDAINRLRGEPGTPVELQVERPSTPAQSAQEIVVTRDVIRLSSVDARRLEGGFGYIRLSQFSAASLEDVRGALAGMTAQTPLSGLILDLRNNAGGLLDQAIKIADEFLAAGTIVTTVGNGGKAREEVRAKPGGETKLPLAVLVNGGTTSAAEVVAGALKHLDRAVIIGTRTFGKGSVQVLFEMEDGGALKLTIAQYLTPGDRSVQSVGIGPDVVLDPWVVSKDLLALFRENRGVREQDLDGHLTSPAAEAADPPALTLRFLQPPGPGTPLADAEEPDAVSAESGFVEDFAITFARGLLGHAKGSVRRAEILGAAKHFFDSQAREERKKVAAELGKLGVDWGAGSEPAKLAARLETDRAGNELAAGETIMLKASVTNEGKAAASQVRAITKCDDPWLADREFVFGRIAPGETRTWQVPVRIERGALPRLDVVRLEVSDGGGSRVVGEPVEIRIQGFGRPRFSYLYHLIDDRTTANGDGLAQPGESLRLHVVVRNVGDARSRHALATLSSRSGEGVQVEKGRFKVDNLEPGASVAVDFTFQVAPDYGGDDVSLQLDVYDAVLREYVTDRLTFPVAPATVVRTAEGMVKVSRDLAEVRVGAATDSGIIGHAAKGTAFQVSGVTDEFTRIELEPGRPAFLLVADAELGTAAPSSAGAGFVPRPQVRPPRLTIDDPPLVIDTAMLRLKVSASDESAVVDSFIFVTNAAAKIDHRKVFYRSNRAGESPKSLSYEAAVELPPGLSMVTVVARQSNQVRTEQTLIVYRR